MAADPATSEDISLFSSSLGSSYIFVTIKESGGEGAKRSGGSAVDDGSSSRIAGRDVINGGGTDVSEYSFIVGSNIHNIDGSDGVISRGGENAGVVSGRKWQRKKEVPNGHKASKEENEQNVYRYQSVVQEKRMVCLLERKCGRCEVADENIGGQNMLLAWSTEIVCETTEDKKNSM